VTFTSPGFLSAAQALAGALAVGLLVGLERGWRDRDLPDGGRVAGLRTFGLIGLLGGMLAMDTSPVPFAVGLAAVALLFGMSYRHASVAAGTLSITTAVAGLVTFALGAVAARGEPMLAIAAAVVVALLLDLKPVLHGWLRLIQPAELNALLQLGVLSAVILPLLPDAGLGPYASLNPFRLWLAVVLIAALSLAGHIASRLRGQRQGMLWVGLLGGLASSTAATLALSRSAQAQPPLARPAAAAIVAACGVMFARMAVVIAALQPGGAGGLIGLLVLLAAASFAVAAWQWRRSSDASAGRASDAPDGKVFGLGTAVAFGAALAIVAVLSRAARDAFGTPGLYTVAFVSGLADVDAIVISSAELLGQGQSASSVVTTAVLLAATANMLVKVGMARVVGGPAVGAAVARGYSAVVLCGAAALAINILR
jgi:uncharacterized membrane protein (DUF4010 family)